MSGHVRRHNGLDQELDQTHCWVEDRAGFVAVLAAASSLELSKSLSLELELELSPELELSLALGLSIVSSAPEGFGGALLAKSSLSSDCSELDESAACDTVTTCFGAAFFGDLGFDVGFGGAWVLVLGFGFGLTAPFGLWIAIVVFGFRGAFSAGESSPLSTNSWLNCAFEAGSLAFECVFCPGKGTGVLLVSFMACGCPCSMDGEKVALAWELFSTAAVHRAAWAACR